MIDFSPRFLLSPRFFALPLAALIMIAALAGLARQTSGGDSRQVVRATTCTAPTSASAPGCQVAGNKNGLVR